MWLGFCACCTRTPWSMPGPVDIDNTGPVGPVGPAGPVGPVGHVGPVGIGTIDTAREGARYVNGLLNAAYARRTDSA